MRDGAGYENSLHSDPRTQRPLDFHTILSTREEKRGGGDTVHGKTKRTKNEIKREEWRRRQGERRRRRTEVVDWVPPEILLFRLLRVSLLSLSPLHLPPR